MVIPARSHQIFLGYRRAQVHGEVIDVVRIMTATKPKLITINRGRRMVGRVRGRSLNEILSVSPAIAAGRPRLVGLPMCRKTSALASAGDVTAGCWASRIIYSRWPLTCTIQVRGENTQMWVVWSLSALIGFCFVLSLFETAPSGVRSRSRERS